MISATLSFLSMIKQFTS